MSNPSMTQTNPVTPMVPPPPPPSQNGTHAIFAAAMAIFGVVTALFPATPLVAAVTAALPPLKIALPIVLTSVGSIWAAVAHPPAFLRRETLP
ncbi:MAG TPA: hypothetical protein VNU46_05485 [Gemmatimonadaceae bacterium]|jgi:hypothetical protein|nr:hypothetical protein [Gemmatimonadaceae bacterium]